MRLKEAKVPEVRDLIPVERVVKAVIDVLQMLFRFESCLRAELFCPPVPFSLFLNKDQALTETDHIYGADAKSHDAAIFLLNKVWEKL